ncbi:hypothetical protein NQK81_01415 [Amycolatopsis roodepoortensis]|uniref:hypothetical protein n=1 Tax=Amycolatopsis roodepoortensis TaxID=700274 RepID=UPI00214CDD40|nr:hypothetical protein [Amycolatopsis roodepoortensis]UUV32134.1 hypothetical protein NQK81_01415 [Amycolatopsis roodepoortensis]
MAIPDEAAKLAGLATSVQGALNLLTEAATQIVVLRDQALEVLGGNSIRGNSSAASAHSVDESIEMAKGACMQFAMNLQDAAIHHSS